MHGREVVLLNARLEFERPALKYASTCTGPTWDMHFGILPEHAFGPECPWYARGSCFRIRVFGRIAEHAVHAQVLEKGTTPWGQNLHPPTHDLQDREEIAACPMKTSPLHSGVRARSRAAVSPLRHGDMETLMSDRDSIVTVRSR